MKIKVKLYGCYELTYSRVYKDILKRIYGENFDVDSAELEIEDISENNTLSIQSQRLRKDYVARVVRIYEDDKLVHIVAMSNTNFDYDKKREYDSGLSQRGKNTFGEYAYHANTYLKQGCSAIFNYYFENKENGVKLSFYLLDIDQSYPHNLYNILSYRELETIGFKILNINCIDFKEYSSVCRSQISCKNIAFPSFNKYMNDIAYISKKHRGNTPSFLQCEEYEVTENDGISYLLEKYIYTFKSLAAQGYDSLFRCWCMKKLADRENAKIEFRLGKQYFAYEEKDKKIADRLTKPIEKTFNFAGINLNYISDDTFLKEKILADDTYLKHKEKNNLRNQTLFRNNLRKKGIPIECVLCGEDKTAILDAAHFWEVSKIKEASAEKIDSFIEDNDSHSLIDQNSKYKDEIFFKKYSLVNSGENGVWMCKNHHGLFDKNYYCFDSEDGKILLHFSDESDMQEFLEGLKSEEFVLPTSILTKATSAFIRQRQYYFEG